MESCWVLPKVIREEDGIFLEKAGFEPIETRLLLSRNLTSVENAQTYLAPPLSPGFDPFLLQDMEPAAQRLAQAIRAGELIMIHGDYDVDGVSATVLLHRVFTLLKGRVTYYLPSRFEEGYGLSTMAMDEAKKRGASVVVSVDCGSTAVKEAAHARQLGLDLIVTDHHEMGDTPRPAAFALINPKQPDCPSPDKNLAGVGVAFKLSQALLTLMKRPMPLDSLFRMVCLGTIADIVPLIGENRAMARHGLEALPQSRNPGLRELLRVCDLTGKEVTAYDVGFRLGPRLNAAGRLEHAGRAVELLLTDDQGRARELAEWLDAENKQRQEIQKRVEEEAARQVMTSDWTRKAGLVVWSNEWHRGVVGIVAGKLRERFHRPAIVISVEEGEGHGSGRSINGFNLFEALLPCGKYLKKFGGHAMAAGLTVSPEQVEPFREAFETVCGERLILENLRPEVRPTVEAELTELTEKTADFLERMEPYGAENPEPLFLVRGVTPLKPPIVMGKDHLKFEVTDKDRRAGMTMVFWRGREAWQRQGLEGKRLDLAARLKWNEWRGRKSLQLEAVAIREAEN